MWPLIALLQSMERTYKGIILGHDVGSSEGDGGILRRGMHLLGNLFRESLFDSADSVSAAPMPKGRECSQAGDILVDVCLAASRLNTFLFLLGQLCDVAVHGVLVVA